VSAGNRLSASSAGGSIYDLGYRHYEGPRRGRGYAVWSLYVESLRGIWGFGRPMSAKAAPFILAGLYAFFAFLQLAFASTLANEISSGQQVQLFTYDSYFTQFGFLLILFCVAQAPEVVCRDQRYQVLPLYFTRAMGRIEYALARLASLVAALFIVMLVPAIALFIGDVLMKPDAFKAFGDELPLALPSIPVALLVGITLELWLSWMSRYLSWRNRSTIAENIYFPDFNNGWIKVILTAIIFFVMLNDLIGYYSSSSLLATLNKENREAMQWVKENTPTESRFLAIDYPSAWSSDMVDEWFPSLSERVSILTAQERNGCREGRKRRLERLWMR